MLKSKVKFLLLIGMVPSLLISCASRAVNYDVAMSEAPAYAPQEMEKMVEYEEVAEEMMAPVPSIDEGSGISDTAVHSSIEPTGKRIVIKNANLSIVVEDPTQSMAQISTMADEMGGFTVSSELYQITTKNGNEVPEATITIRVPAEDLNKALETIKSLTEDQTTDILSENISGQDVTKEYTDLQSRLSNLQNTQKQLEQIMADAYKTEDVLSVYLELASINEQIEVIRGQIKYYDETSSLSAISIRLVPQESIEPLTIGKWEPQGIARDAVQALIEAIKFIISALIWIILFVLPILILIAIPIFLIVILIKKAFKSRKAKSKKQSEEKKDIQQSSKSSNNNQ